jgi:hypothetical protein
MHNFKFSNGYASIHLECGEIPVPRVVGGILMGLGINFNDQVQNAGALKVQG